MFLNLIIRLGRKFLFNNKSGQSTAGGKGRNSDKNYFDLSVHASVYPTWADMHQSSSADPSAVPRVL